jgi:hypothetical protein
MPAQAGIQFFGGNSLDSRVRGNDAITRTNRDEALLTVVIVSKNNKEEFYEEAKRYENNSDI